MHQALNGNIEYTRTTDLLAEEELNDYSYFDLSATFRFMDAHRVVVGINNVFDEEPPLLGGTLSTNGNTIAGYYATLGLFLFANLTLAW